MWDLLITAGNIAFLPGLALLMADRHTYIPRLISLINMAALVAVVIGLIGAGFVMSPAIASLGALGWVFIYVFRGRRLPPGS